MKNRLFICIFFALLLSGLIFQLWGQRFDLYGTSASSQTVTIDSGIMDGTWQSEAESVFNDKLVLRSWLIPIHNQITYSVFHTSPHDNIVLGKENYLYEENYILKELQIIPPVSDKEMDQLAAKLSLLQDRLASQGKNLFLFITPSKAHIYSEYIPELYLSLSPQPLDTSSYEKLLLYLEKYSLHYYDSVPFVLATRDSTEYPAYTTTGVHWSQVKGFAVIQELAAAMKEQLNVNLPEFELSWSITPKAIGLDRDAEDLLNLFSAQPNTYYAPGVTITDAEKDNISILARGGSFMSATVYNMIDFDFFSSSYYMENTLLIDNGEISYFTSYEELPIAEQLELADIVLLEVNEEAIEDMSFGFIDYLLENVLTE